jgi:uncharacterized phage protein (TIGR01671 family)
MNLKLRVWDVDKKIMYYPKDMYNYFDIVISSDENGNQNIYLKCDYRGYIPPIYYIVELFTGLTDKNGVEIYEGDRVKWGHLPGFSSENPIRIAVVELKSDIQFNSQIGIFHFGQFSYKETHKYLEVIGNIHENPELISVEVQ